AETWDFVRLRVAAGVHRIALRLRSTGQKWPLAVRLLDTRNLEPPLGCRLRLTLDDAGARLVRQGLVSVRISAGLSAKGYAPAITLPFSHGFSWSATPTWHVRGRVGKRIVFDRDVPPSTSGPTRVALDPLAGPLPDVGTLTLDVDVGSSHARAE